MQIDPINEFLSKLRYPPLSRITFFLNLYTCVKRLLDFYVAFTVNLQGKLCPYAKVVRARYEIREHSFDLRKPERTVISETADEWHLNLRHSVVDAELPNKPGRAGKKAAKAREMNHLAEMITRATETTTPLLREAVRA